MTDNHNKDMKEIIESSMKKQRLDEEIIRFDYSKAEPSKKKPANTRKNKFSVVVILVAAVFAIIVGVVLVLGNRNKSDQSIETEINNKGATYSVKTGKINATPVTNSSDKIRVDEVILQKTNKKSEYADTLSCKICYAYFWLGNFPIFMNKTTYDYGSEFIEGISFFSVGREVLLLGIEQCSDLKYSDFDDMKRAYVDGNTMYITAMDGGVKYMYVITAGEKLEYAVYHGEDVPSVSGSEVSWTMME